MQPNKEKLDKRFCVDCEKRFCHMKLKRPKRLCNERWLVEFLCAIKKDIKKTPYICYPCYKRRLNMHKNSKLCSAVASYFLDKPEKS